MKGLLIYKKRKHTKVGTPSNRNQIVSQKYAPIQGGNKMSIYCLIAYIEQVGVNATWEGLKAWKEENWRE